MGEEREGGVRGRGEGGRGERVRRERERRRDFTTYYTCTYTAFFIQTLPSSPNKESLVVGERDAGHSTDMPRQDRGAPCTDQGPSRQQQCAVTWCCNNMSPPLH